MHVMLSKEVDGDCPDPFGPCEEDEPPAPFSKVPAVRWRDWRWQIKNRIATQEVLEKLLVLTEEERASFLDAPGRKLPIAITPYYFSLIDPTNPDDPIRKCVIPRRQELLMGPGEAEDPLGEQADSPVPGLVHRYPDRVLFLLTGRCSTYCRYCTRSRLVGDRSHTSSASSKRRWERCIEYIRSNPRVRDVILSGGDPLVLESSVLEWVLEKLSAIPHVEMIRIGSKVPAVLPQRITPALVGMLRRYHPLYLSLHFTHPAELTPATRQACERLADGGIPLGSQTVLLKGVNDDAGTLGDLFRGLLRIRVRPYYLYQCDPIAGSAHFRTRVEEGIDIIRGLRGHTSGYAVPTYVIDAPGGGGKIPILPGYVTGRVEEGIALTNYAGGNFVYPEATVPVAVTP